MKEREIIANLSHSYFNYILKDVQPFLKYFNHIILTSSLSPSLRDESPFDVNTDSEVIERLFFMGCLNSKDISLPFNYSYYKPKSKIEKYEWFTDIQLFGSKSKQGVVKKSLIFDNINIVVKKAKNFKFDEITIRDFCIGISLNKILNKAPFFVRTLGCFEHKKHFYIATEFIDGINLKTYIQDKKSNFIGFLNIFFQILLGLEVAQEKLNFCHYDLHTDNVILVPQNQPFEVSLYGQNYVVKHAYKPVMIDFGLSSIHTKGHTLGQKSLETKGIYNYLSPGYDIYIFLLFCIDIAQSSNMSIFNGITDLLTFFKIKTSLSIDILTNNHIKCLKKGVSKLIPNQFIQYLTRNYSNYLNVDIEFKKNHKCLGKQPLSLKLKQIFNVELEPLLMPLLHNNIDSKKKLLVNELDIDLSQGHRAKRNGSANQKGFIKSLLNNIKIYYWYKEKINLSCLNIKNLIEIDCFNLQNLIDDLNLTPYLENQEMIATKVTVEQKNFFFIALDYYYLIIELELRDQHPFYKKWINDFKETFVYKNIFKQLNEILYEERMKKLQF